MDKSDETQNNNYVSIHAPSFLRPKDYVNGLFEHDNPTKTKAVLSDVMSISGGMSTFTLKHGTKKECVDLAKKSIDMLAPEEDIFSRPINSYPMFILFQSC